MTDDPLARQCLATVGNAWIAAAADAVPFRHWLVDPLLPAAVLAHLVALELTAVDHGRRSGSRELHNAQRRYFDPACLAGDPICAAVARAFQSPSVTTLIQLVTGAQLSGTRLRIEYALDSAGFWLEPHTDLGVKRFTLLLYLDGGGGDLGADLYGADRTWARRVPFLPNSGVAFVPDDRTWHGFEPRTFTGVRRSLIINYVDAGWRAVEQLAFPDATVGPRSF